MIATCERIRCGRCQVVAINGICCHEQGCPDSHIDGATGEPFKAECHWCGSPCEPTTYPGPRAFCGESCKEDYYS